MVNMKAFAAKILAAAVLGLVASNADAVYIYNNSVNDQTNRLSAVDNLWFGDEVILSTNSTDRFMTGFNFQYWATNTSGLTIDVRLQLNNGTPFNGYATPGTVVYELLAFPLLNTDAFGRSTLNFDISDLDFFDTIADGGTLLTLDNLTLALQFNFHGGGGEAGVDLYNPPTEGFSYLDYWVYDSGSSSWQLNTNNVFGTVNFGMTIEAVPEPSVFSIFIMGGLMALGFRRLFNLK